jgi:probable addiction module antidote protein
MTRKKSRPYKIGLHERLRDYKHAISYINAALAEDSTEGFLMALRDVVEAMQGMSALAEDASVNRENLYRMLSDHGNPRLESLNAVLSALDLRLQVTKLHSRSGPSHLADASRIATGIPQPPATRSKPRTKDRTVSRRVTPSH